MSKSSEFDRYLSDEGPAALVIREFLMPVEGRDGVLFPSTYAAGPDGDFKGGYNIDGDPAGEKIALIDSVGSQANRMEPLFAEPAYAKLIPQVKVSFNGGQKSVSLLSAGHRAGDALVRASALGEELQKAFVTLLDGDATPLAKIAPTSLVFGVWDSRDTQAKAPRLIASTIRAFDVRPLTRSAQFVPATDYVGNGLLEEPSDKATDLLHSQRGFRHQPATNVPGGVIAKGDIRRDATLAIAALRLIHAGPDPVATRKLRRYLLGLALVAFTRPAAGYLRQGTILVLDPDRPREFVEVMNNGRRVPLTLTHEQALAFATSAAEEFGVGSDRSVPFDTEKAKEDLKPKKEKGGKKGKAPKAAAPASEEKSDA